MNEERKLSEMLDEIFGDYINNKSPDLEKLSKPQAEIELDYFIPKESDYIIKEQDFYTDDSIRPKADNYKLDFFMPGEPKPAEHFGTEPTAPDNLISLIENLFTSEDIINETDLSFNRFSAARPVPPVVQPLPSETLLEKPETKIYVKEQSFETPPENFYKKKHDDRIKDEKLTSIQQAYVAKAICNQLYELFYIYNKLKFSKRNNTNMPAYLKSGINEIKPAAESVYKKIAGQNTHYLYKDINLNNGNPSLSLIKNKINAIIYDTESLHNSVKDNELKNSLVQIKTLLSFQLEAINKLN